jgi:hypothetical protein
MQDPFDSGIAVGKIVCTGAAVDRQKVITGEHLPMKNASGYLSEHLSGEHYGDMKM